MYTYILISQPAIALNLVGTSRYTCTCTCTPKPSRLPVYTIVCILVQHNSILLLSPFLRLSLLSLFPFLSLMLVCYTHIFHVYINLMVASFTNQSSIHSQPTCTCTCTCICMQQRSHWVWYCGSAGQSLLKYM